MPPIPPEDRNLERIWDFVPVNKTEEVQYKCKRGMRLKTEVADDPRPLTCQDGNLWDEPATDDDWEQCVPSKKNVAKIVLRAIRD